MELSLEPLPSLSGCRISMLMRTAIHLAEAETPVLGGEMIAPHITSTIYRNEMIKNDVDVHSAPGEAVKSNAKHSIGFFSWLLTPATPKSITARENNVLSPQST